MTTRLSATLTEGSVRGHLVRMAVPMVWGLIAMMGFNLADTWFVARLGTVELAAMSFTFPVVMAVISLGIGLMAGTSSVLARAIGEADARRVRRLTTDALALTLALSVVIAAAGLVTLEPLFRLLGADDETLPLIRQYMVPWYLGVPFVLVPMAGGGAIRATGHTRLQSRILIGASLLNLVLDPLLIFGLAGFPRLEMTGAALATVIARVGSLAAVVWVLHARLGMLGGGVPSTAELLASWRRVLHVGLPAAGANVIIPVATGFVVALVAGFGLDAVAGFGAAARIEGLTMVVFYALSSVIGPFVGQNLGAGRVDRILEARQESLRLCLACGAVVAVVLALAAPALVALFTDSAQAVAAGSAYLRIVPWSFGAAGVVMVVNAAFNGLGHPLPAVSVSALRTLGLYVPGAWLGASLLGLDGIFAAACAANLLAAAAAHRWLGRVCQGL